MTVQRRPAFTLIELLVVIAIIAILIALLVPAVQKVRDAAARTQCTNNLKQQGLALQNYVGVYKVFPPAYKTTTTGVSPGWGWGTFLLPYLEQMPLYTSLDPENTVFSAANPAATPNAWQKSVLPVYRCPANSAPELNPDRFNFGLSNYRAVAGPANFPNFVENLDTKGVMYQNSRIKISQITDGTSNTAVIGECRYDLGGTPKRTAAIWAGMTGNATTVPAGARISDVMWWVDDATATTAPNTGLTYVINGTAPQAFSSVHSGGAQFCFGDGTVRFFRDSPGSMTQLKWLAGRDDGNAVTLD